jgi:hypothetical protein
MSRRRNSFDEGKIARFYKEGRGVGSGVDYKPWLNIRDVPSHGRSHRLRGMTIGRIYHFLSDIECRLFYLLDWAANVQDIREQFPLNRDITKRIAEQINVAHPIDQSSKTSLVMTTDFVIDVVRDGHIDQIARAVKPAKELDNVRVIEKLEIERRYWLEKGVDWAIVTEKEILRSLSENISWVHNYASLDDLKQPHAGYYTEKCRLVMNELEPRSDMSLGNFC